METVIKSISFVPLQCKDAKSWRGGDKKFQEKVNNTILSILRNPKKGKGKPHPLKEIDGFWQREIDKDHIIIYEVKSTHLTIIDFV